MLLFLLIMAMSFGFAATYQIGDGTATQNNVPCYGYYDYSVSKTLYTAAEIAAAGLNSPEGLIGIGYDISNTPNNYLLEDQYIYMRHTDATVYEDANMISSDGFTLVYSGDINFNGGGWFFITFDAPFPYDGSSGIEILWENRNGDYATGYPSYRSTGMTNMAAYKNQDNTFPEAPIAGSWSMSRPNITLASPQVTPPNAATLVAPADGGLVVAESVTLQWANGGGFPAGYKLYVGTSNPPTFVEDLGDVTSYLLTDLAEDTTYYWKVVPYNDNGDQTDVPVWSFDANPEGMIIVGDGTLTQRYPFGHLWGFERSASLYTLDSIGSVGVIESIGWDCVALGTVPVPYKIYLGTTTETEMQLQSFTDLTENMTLVHEGEYTFSASGWHTFDLDEAFTYVGGNLIVAVETNYGGGGGLSSETFRYTGGNTNKHIYWQADNNPPVTTGTRSANLPNLMLQLGALTGEPQLSVSPASINFGEAIFGATIGPRNISLSNIGAGSLTIAAADVSLLGSPQFSYDDSVFPIVLESAEIVTLPVSFTGTIEGAAEATITISYGGEDFEVELSGIVLPEGLVVIGNGTTNGYMPVNAYYGYSYAQMLYKADEIMTQDSQLEKIAFHWNGVGAAPNSNEWTVYIGHTDKTAFADTSDWIELDDLSLVYEGTLDIPAENMWIELEFAAPFVYNGADNLVIAVLESKPGYDSSSYFFYNTASTAGRALRCSSDGTVPNPATPPAGALAATYPNIKMFFADLPEEPVLAVIPNVDEWNFGSKAVFSTSTKEFTIANNGAGVLSVNNVTVTGEGFALQEAFEATNLASTESFVITVVYNPEEAGDYEGLLAITTGHGSREIDLLGSCYDPIITEFPFFEGFEVGNTEGSTTIAQWEQIIGPSYNDQYWTANSTQTGYNRTPRTGDWNITLRWNGESTIVRPVMLEAGQGYGLELWARQDDNSGAVVKAVLGRNEQLTGDLIQVMGPSNVVSGDYQQFYGEFIAPETGLFYLGIYGSANYTPWYLSLDDITFDLADVQEELVPPNNLQASVDGMDVSLTWNAPGDVPIEPADPQWITWCDVETYYDAIGTNGEIVFDVAHRYDANDLIPFQDMVLTKMKFVPQEISCTYTAKVWTGTSAFAPGELIYSQVVNAPVIGDWNEVVFNTPVPIPATGELWIGYEADTLGGHPAGCDDGPHVAGKGNMIYFDGLWLQLTDLSDELTYNWSIQGYVDNASAPDQAIALKPIQEKSRPLVQNANFSRKHSLVTKQVEPVSRELNRFLNGYYVYRDDSLIATINDPATLEYLDAVTAAGVYSYTVTAIYDGGESEPAGPVEVEVEAPAAPVFAITPTSHNFGQVNVGSTQSQQFTISNAGAGTLTINAITISGAMMSLGTLPTLPVNLTAGQTLEFNANYTPTAEGAHTGAITITDNLTRIAHTVALSGTGVDMGDLYPPTNLQASVSGMDVTLTWEPPVTGEWITWCIPEDIGNGIGTNSAATFDVAHRFDANDLAPYQGNAITRVSFVPNEANCVYTVKLWAGTSAAAPSTMIHSQVVSSPVIGAWNEVLLTSPVTIPATGELWVGFESNTQEGYPAGCDNGPAVNGKGNMINMGGWDTLIDVAPTLNYNWSIMAYVDYEARALVHADQPAIAEPVVSVNKTATTRNVAELSVNNDLTVASHEIPGVNRARTGYNLYRDNVLVGTVAENEDYIYVDSVTSFGTYAYTVTAVYDEGESAPEGPVVVTVADLEPPTDLGYSIAQNHVTLNWANPTPPLEGEWISWSNNDDLGNSIGTGGATSFEVAHRYAASDLTDHVGGRIAKVMIVPGYEFCTYTVKVWTGGNASSPGNLMATQVVENPQVGTWNSVILYNPVEILAGQELWIGYHVNTQGGHPAGCDNGPMVSGKGNMMNMGGWTTLDAVAASLTYNWQIQGLVVQTRDGKNVETPILVDNQSTSPMSTLSLAQVSPKKDRNVVLVGYRVYRDGEYIGSVNDPDITTFTQRSVPNGVYVYGVTGVYNTGESSPATIEVTVNLELEEAVFEDSFEEYADFATAFEPWTLRDQDGSESYGFTGIEFPGSGSAFAYMIFNPSQTVPPIVGLDPYEGAKMAASFAAVNGPNNDYLITPRIQLGTNSAIRFFARSHTAQYGLERFKAAVSIMPSPGIMSGYNYVSGDEDVLVPANWTEYYYDISNYDNQQVYIAVRCVSDDAFVFYVDNFSVHTDLTSNEDEFAPVAVTQLAGNYPNPFNPETTISYSMKEAGSVSIDIYNIKGQLVKHLVKGDMAAGNHTVVWNGTDNNNRAVSSGVYFYKMNSGNYSSTKKMIMMK
jgi:hypothetical protein